MRILVTGGSGLIGHGVVSELLSRGHQVRLLSRHADDDVHEWNGVEGFSGDVADVSSIEGAAAGCEAVIHIAGIAEETPPDSTFEKVNVEGTQHLLDQCERGGARRFVFVSSLGADRGHTDYQKSKMAAEKAVRASSLDWTIVRPGNVYGPGDEVISTILQMVRTLPVVPVIDDGEQQFAPVWHEDLAAALVTVAERPDLRGRILEVTGTEQTSMNDLLERLGRVTGREPARIPVPLALASLSTKVARAFVHLPVDDTKLAMLDDHIFTDRNALVSPLGIEPTSLDEGLRRLADELPEQLPEHGVGSMRQKRFSSVITGGGRGAAGVMDLFRNRLNDVMPLDFEAEAREARVETGATITAKLPIRGHIQVRVETVEPRRVLFATVEGHPIAGTVEFRTEDVEGGVRFTIEIFARHANYVDLIAMRTVGNIIQDANWRAVIRRVAKLVGGEAGPIEHTSEKLDDGEAAERERTVKEQVQARKRSS